MEEKEEKQEEVNNNPETTQGENTDNQAQSTTPQEGQNIILTARNAFDAALYLGVATFINFPLMKLEKTKYRDMKWPELCAYFEDADAFMKIEEEEKIKLYNAVKDKILKDEFGFDGFPVLLSKTAAVKNALGVTFVQKGIISITDKDDEKLVDIYDDNRDFYNDRRFAGLKTLNTIIHETRHAYQAMKINKWFRNEKEKDLDFAQVSFILDIICGQLKNHPQMYGKKHLDPKSYKYLMSHYEFDARRYANKKMTNMLNKGYFQNTELAQEFIHQSEMVEYVTMVIGSKDKKNLKCINLEMDLMCRTLNYFKTNFDSELCTDLFELVDKFDMNKYYDEMAKEFDRLHDSARVYVAKFVDKCYKTPELKKYAPKLKEIMKNHGVSGFMAAKDYIEIIQKESMMIREEERQNAASKTSNAEKIRTKLPERSEWMEFMRKLLNDKPREYEASHIAKPVKENIIKFDDHISVKITGIGKEEGLER